jgi:hypothetical protein
VLFLESRVFLLEGPAIGRQRLRRRKLSTRVTRREYELPRQNLSVSEMSPKASFCDPQSHWQYSSRLSTCATNLLNKALELYCTFLRFFSGSGDSNVLVRAKMAQLNAIQSA